MHAKRQTPLPDDLEARPTKITVEINCIVEEQMHADNKMTTTHLLIIKTVRSVLRFNVL